MDNLNSSAYPLVDSYESGGTHSSSNGFTKLELASLMIAQGLATRELLETLETKNYPLGVAKLALSIAKAVLDQANK